MSSWMETCAYLKWNTFQQTWTETFRFSRISRSQMMLWWGGGATCDLWGTCGWSAYQQEQPVFQAQQRSALITSEEGEYTPDWLQPGWETLVALSHQELHPHVPLQMCSPTGELRSHLGFIYIFVGMLESCYLLLSFKMLSMLIFIFFLMKIPLLGIFAVIEKQKCNTLGNTECRWTDCFVC